MARAVVVDHVFIRMRKLEESRRFYEAALAPLGFGIPYSYEGGCSLGIEGADGGAEDFWNLAGNTPSINVYVAFSATDREAVDAFHHTALEAGATTTLPGSAPSTKPATTAPSSSTPTATTSRRCTTTATG